MTDLERKAMKRVFELLEIAQGDLRDATEILRQALAQPEQYDQTALELCDVCGWKAVIPDEGCLVCARKNQEPVMWSIFDGKSHDVFDTKYDADKMTRFKNGKVLVKPLYTAPPKHAWVGLTDEEIHEMIMGMRTKNMGVIMTEEIFRDVEAKLKEKNGGQD